MFRGKGNTNPTPTAECLSPFKHWKIITFSQRIRLCSPHPGPLPWGEGESFAVLGDDPAQKRNEV